MVGQVVLIYDADCGFCRWATERLLAWERRGRLRAVALQSPEANRLLGDMDQERRIASWHLVTAGRSVYSGGAAAAPLLALLPSGRPLAAAASVFPTTTDRAYAWIARHRDRLGRILGAERCSVDPTRSRSHRSRPA